MGRRIGRGILSLVADIAVPGALIAGITCETQWALGTKLAINIDFC